MNIERRLTAIEAKIAKAPQKAQPLKMEIAKPVIIITDVKNNSVPIWQSDIDRWQDTYPAVDILQETKKANSWLLANPKRNKINIHRFLNNWFSRQQDRGVIMEKTDNRDNPTALLTELTRDELIKLVADGLDMYFNYLELADELIDEINKVRKEQKKPKTGGITQKEIAAIYAAEEYPQYGSKIVRLFDIPEMYNANGVPHYDPEIVHKAMAKYTTSIYMARLYGAKNTNVISEILNWRQCPKYKEEDKVCKLVLWEKEQATSILNEIFNITKIAETK